MNDGNNSMDGAIDRSQTDWYRDAIIYQVHVKAFQDSDGDGMGDFAGLMRRLDYIQDLGVTAIWLLPFYPSPLRDDGYDIADYRSINPSYGTMKDFRAFVAEAHRRGLRVITELVINHTSDQHPWFQKARLAKPGSAARDFYVWSDTDAKFLETRIIFLDTEKSNWTWDPVAGAFYWHRFYSHQPDLNFDNPRVLKEVLKVMHMWLDMGVDGLRLDAIPYLVEREGTNNENLPETHAVLKKIRAELDAHYTDRMLLAEANQWPEDTRPYFGDGDECHMGFHFPLMPRIYMALAQEDRYPISDIIRQTPDIPEGCQWGIFLRNHDELTLEMVSDQERDYLWRTYAEDRRARINLGIRRRLAPLMQNDRRKIELMNSLLMSMPGTPIVYYGDELGMGDNYYLGDRDGVRTPMQWSQDLNAGFSRANPQQLFLPVIMDPIYGYQAVNAESQQQDPSSLLNWMRKLIQVRKQHAAFGRGTMTLLYPRNRKILAYVREHGNDRILCVANLSRQAQAVELDLSRFRGAVPIELTGRSPFPPIGDLPYLFTLPAFGFYWLLLADEAEAPRWHQAVPDMLPDFVTLTTRDGRVTTALSGSGGKLLESETLPQFLRLQRWFSGKDRAIGSATIRPLAEIDGGRHLLAECHVDLGGEVHRYFMPLSARWGEENIAFGAPTLSFTLAKLRQGPRLGALVDAAQDDGFGQAVIAALREGNDMPVPGGTVRFDNNGRADLYAEAGAPRPLGVEQSNVSIAFGDSIIFKIYRRLRDGVQPEVEMARFLTNVGHFSHMPAYLGAIEHQADGEEPTVLATAFEFVRNQGDAWDILSAALQRDLENEDMISNAVVDAGGEGEPFFFPLNLGGLLGQRTAELHKALAAETDDEAFRIEQTTRADVEGWVAAARADLDEALRALEGADRKGEAGAMIDRVLSRRSDFEKRLAACLDHEPSGARSRVHGDYHLGQVLIAADDVVLIDFEGEPHRTIEERRAKTTPLVDVAGMLRSIDYLAADVLRLRGPLALPADERAVARAARWRGETSRAFLEAYREMIAGCPTHSADTRFERDLLDLFQIQKAAYEVAYELANRPSWVDIPLRGLLDLLDNSGAEA
ncbi:MAG: maltose alpha-D-glucosyltransferase [Mesorhizobium sp.]